MLANRSILGRLCFSILVCSLLCGVVSAELPELLSLTDNTSNDFTISKPSGRELIPKLSTAIHESASYAKNPVYFALSHSERTFVSTGTVSADVFVLYSVLRR